jgi:hypothetical protein
MLLELCTRCLDERTVMHSRRAHRLTGAAIETLVHLLVEFRIQQIEATVSDCLHHPQSSTRRRCFISGQAVGWTGWKTHPAMDARTEQIIVGDVRAAVSMRSRNHILDRNVHSDLVSCLMERVERCVR